MKRSPLTPTVFAVAALLCASAAHAQSTAPAGDPRALFEQGIRHLGEQRFADAIASLEASRALRSSPVVTYNLGLAYRGIGRVQDSIAAFEAYLAQPSRTATPDELAQVRQALAQQRRSLVRIDATLDPPGSELRIDGRVEERRAAITVDPGPHLIEASAPGYRHATQRVTYPSGSQQRVQIRLERPDGFGVLRVEPNVADAVVFIDGARAGTGSVERRLPEGVHRIRVEAPRYVSRERDVRVERDEQARVEVALDSTARRGVPGWVIGTSVAGAVALAGGIALVAVLAAPPPTEYTNTALGSGWLGNGIFVPTRR